MRRKIQQQLLLPLLEVLSEAGGRARPAEIYEEVARRIDLTPEERAEVIVSGRQSFPAFNQQVRWTRQTAITKGFLARGSKWNLWELADVGKERLLNARPGVVLTVFETGRGRALWASFEDALGVIEDSSVDLLFTSPPYAGIAKAYGTHTEANWVDFMSDALAAWQPKIAPGGSTMLNIGSPFVQGAPHLSLAVERFTIRAVDEIGLDLLDKLYWHSPNRIASPVQWVAVRRCRLKPSVEPILWFAKRGEIGSGDNRRVLRPYKDPERWLAKGDGNRRHQAARPSGHIITGASFAKDNGGSIPDVLIRAGVGGGRRDYSLGCQAEGLPRHPAIMPLAVARFCIDFGCPDGGVVWDPFGGSSTTGLAAEEAGRRWITSERSLTYALGARHRFSNSIRVDNCELVEAGTALARGD